jgi:hypothetical protein
VHELVHAFDHAAGRCDFGTCEGVAYSEVSLALHPPVTCLRPLCPLSTPVLPLHRSVQRGRPNATPRTPATQPPRRGKHSRPPSRGSSPPPPPPAPPPPPPPPRRPTTPSPPTCTGGACVPRPCAPRPTCTRPPGPPPRASTRYIDTTLLTPECPHSRVTLLLCLSVYPHNNAGVLQTSPSLTHPPLPSCARALAGL